MANILRLGPFSDGLRGDYGFYGSRGIRIQELRNFFVTRQGFLQRRGGCSHLNSTAHTAMIKQVFVAPFTYEAATGIPITVPRLLGIAYSATALRLITSSAYTEIKRGLSSGDVSLRIFNFDQATPPFVMFSGRCFIGIYSSTDRGFVWCDSTSLGNSTCYAVGGTAPAAAPGVAAASGGDFTQDLWYSFRYTYYNSTHGIETVASAADAALTTSVNKIITVTCTQIVNEGFNQFRIYRNQTGQSTAALAEAADHYLVGAQSMTNGTSTQAFAVTGTTIESVAYTLDTDSSYLDLANHDTLSQIPTSMAVWNDRLWVTTEPRTLAWSKKTTDAIYPDWFPTEQRVTLGSAWDRVSAVVVAPTTEVLLVLTRHAIFSITLEGSTGIDINQFAAIGCPYPRTIAAVGDWIYFLGSDNQVWRTDGSMMQTVSKQANHLISHIKPSWHMFPSGVAYKDKYELIFSSGSAIFTTTNNATTTHSNQVVSSTVSTTARLTPSSGTWDLSSVVVGQFVESTTNPGLYYGYVCAVDDANDRIDVDGNTQALASDQYRVLKNDRVLVFDTTFDYWYEVRGWDLSDAYWDSISSDDLYGVTSDGGYVDLLDTTDTTDADAASTAAITSLVKFEQITSEAFRQAAGRVRPTALYVMPSGTATSVTAGWYKDFATSTDGTETHTPVTAENWRIGLHPSGYARAYEIEVSGSAVMTIAAIDVELEVMG